MVHSLFVWQRGLLGLVLFCLLPCSAAWAQSGNGALRGSILDADFSVPVAGVSVSLEGSGQGATSTEDGSFFINDIPPGQYTLLAIKDGFVRERRSGVLITPGSVKEIDLEMTAEVVELDEFVVSQEELIDTTAGTETITLRTELKTFTEVLGQQFISQTGASDAAKLLAKTTGVNVADGKFVVVRGLNDRYNVVSLNSLRIPSSDPDRRAVALDLFPTAVIQDVRTSKTFLPDLNGESTGGTINIVTKAVPDENFAKFKVGTGYNTQSTGNNKFLSYQGGGTGMFGTAENRKLPDFIRNSDLPALSGSSRSDSPERLERQRVNDALSPVMGTTEIEAPMDLSLEASLGHRGEFMGAPAGITVATDYSKKYIYNDDDFVGRYVFAPVGQSNQGEVQLVRRTSLVRSGQETMRAGLLVAAGFQPDDDDEIVFTYFFNRVAEDRATLQLGQLDLNSFSATDRDYRETLTYTQRDLRVMQLAGKHIQELNGKELDIRWAMAYNQSSQLEPDHRFVRGILDLSSLTPSAGGVTGVYNPVPGNPVVPEFQRLWRELYDENYSAKFDVTTDLFEGEDGVSAKIKFGGLLDYSDREYRSDGFVYSRGSENQQFPNLVKPGFPGATWADVFLSGNLPVGTDPDGIPNNGPITPVNQFNYLYRAGDFEAYQASQIIAGGYTTLDFDLSPGLNIALGGRIESTDIKIQSTEIWRYPDEVLRFALLSDADRLGQDQTLKQLVNAAFLGDVNAQNDPRLAARSRAAINEQHFLPALSVNWDSTEHTRIRAAISRTVARPSFKELAPVVFLNVESGDLFVGNPDLEMSEIMNYDTRWEWFPTPGSLLGVSFFAKRIQKPIEYAQEGGDAAGPALVRYVNSDEGSVYGMELEFQRDLSFIAEELKHFSIGANYSYIKSQATRPVFVGNSIDPVTGELETIPSVFGKSRRLQGQPDYIVNFNFNYDNPEKPLTLGAFLNITGPQLFAVGGTPQDPDVFQEPFTTFDLSIGYRLNKYSRLTFRAQNLLNAQVTRYFNNQGRPLHSTRQTGIGFTVSLTMDW